MILMMMMENENNSPSHQDIPPSLYFFAIPPDSTSLFFFLLSSPSSHTTIQTSHTTSVAFASSHSLTPKQERRHLAAQYNPTRLNPTRLRPLGNESSQKRHLVSVQSVPPNGNATRGISLQLFLRSAPLLQATKPPKRQVVSCPCPVLKPS